MTPAGITCIRNALVAHYTELAQRGEIPCAEVPILADIDINQIKGGMNMDANKETLRATLKRVDGYGVAIEALLELWTLARERNTRTPRFNKAMVAAAAVLRSHGKLS